jgi:hypothetical protein
VTPFVAPKTSDKIVFLRAASEVRATLAAHFEPADVPTEYGGTGQFRHVTGGPAPWEAQHAPRRRRY